MAFVTDPGDIAVDSVSPSIVEDNGGQVITINGAFMDADVFVFVGDIACYSGIAGRGLRCKPKADGTCTFIAPPLSVGVTYSLLVQQEGEDLDLFDAIDVENRQWRTRTFSLKSAAMPLLAVGPRSVEEIDPLP